MTITLTQLDDGVPAYLLKYGEWGIVFTPGSTQGPKALDEVIKEALSGCGNPTVQELSYMRKLLREMGVTEYTYDYPNKWWNR